MKKTLQHTFTFLLVLVSFVSNGQSFTLSDTVVDVGDIYRPSSDIFYELDKYQVLPRSYSQLDSIVSFLFLNPNIVMEIGVHTDSRESDKYSVRTSPMRARSVTTYLNSKGVPADRLIPVGYGESRLRYSDEEIAKLKTDEEKEALHRKNRRTEFKIMSLDYVRKPEFDLSSTYFEVGDVYRPKINFEFNKKTILPESYSLLDSIASFLLDNPKLKTEVSFHTDTRSSDITATKLDLGRARNIVDYLIQKGVNSKHLIPIGYGGNRPLISDEEIANLQTEEEKEAAHRSNRRTEFTILSLDFKTE